MATANKIYLTTIRIKGYPIYSDFLPFLTKDEYCKEIMEIKASLQTKQKYKFELPWRSSKSGQCYWDFYSEKGFNLSELNGNQMYRHFIPLRSSNTPKIKHVSALKQLKQALRIQTEGFLYPHATVSIVTFRMLKTMPLETAVDMLNKFHTSNDISIIFPDGQYLGHLNLDEIADEICKSIEHNTPNQDHYAGDFQYNFRIATLVSSNSIDSIDDMKFDGNIHHVFNNLCNYNNKISNPQKGKFNYNNDRKGYGLASYHMIRRGLTIWPAQTNSISQIAKKRLHTLGCLHNNCVMHMMHLNSLLILNINTLIAHYAHKAIPSNLFNQIDLAGSLLTRMHPRNANDENKKICTYRSILTEPIIDSVLDIDSRPIPGLNIHDFKKQA